MARYKVFYSVTKCFIVEAESSVAAEKVVAISDDIELDEAHEWDWFRVEKDDGKREGIPLLAGF